MYIRQAISAGTPRVLAVISTVALRYSHVRTQFKTDSKPPVERPIIDYKLQKGKIYPIIAKSYATFFNYKILQKMIEQNAENVKHNNDFSLMKELHIIMCINKAYGTAACNDAEFTLMQACGGHGFLHASGISKMIDGGFPGVILEGENTILLIQISNELDKTMLSIMRGEEGKVLNHLKYVANTRNFDKFCKTKYPRNTQAKFRDIDTYLNIFGQTVFYLVNRYITKSQNYIQNLKINVKDTTDKHLGIDRVEASKIHSIYTMLNFFNEHLKSLTNVSSGLRNAVHKLALIFAIEHLRKFSSEFFSAKTLNSEELSFASELYEVLLDEIHPDALVLAEGFGYPEHFLNNFSVLTNNDGKVYENLLAHAKKHGSLNKFDVHPTMLEYIEHQKNGSMFEIMTANDKVNQVIKPKL